MENLVPAGVVQGKAAYFELGETGTGKEQIFIQFAITQPAELAGRSVNWYGFFTEKALERTIESMRYCGWQGNDLENLAGMNANEVQLVIEHETYKEETTARVAFVNALGGGLKKVLDPVRKKSFAAQMRGQIAAIGQGSTPASQRSAPSQQRSGPPEPPPLSDSDFPPF